MHSLLTILLYIRFVKSNRSKSIVTHELREETNLYFDQLKSMWN